MDSIGSDVFSFTNQAYYDTNAAAFVYGALTVPLALWWRGTSHLPIPAQVG